jgi:Skp family chaperone for outer membrane proteins
MKKGMKLSSLLCVSLFACAHSLVAAHDKTKNAPSVALPAATAEQVSVAARPTKIASLDSIRLLRESDEGKRLEKEIQGDVKAFEEKVMKANNELALEGESLNKQASLLKKDVLQERAEKLKRLQKEKQRDLEAGREELSESIQQRQYRLREKQLDQARDVLEKKGWELVIEKNAPFVIAASSSIDKTDEVLKEINSKFVVGNQTAKPSGNA